MHGTAVLFWKRVVSGLMDLAWWSRATQLRMDGRTDGAVLAWFAQQMAMMAPDVWNGLMGNSSEELWIVYTGSTEVLLQRSCDVAAQLDL